VTSFETEGRNLNQAHSVPSDPRNAFTSSSDGESMMTCAAGELEDTMAWRILSGGAIAVLAGAAMLAAASGPSDAFTLSSPSLEPSVAVAGSDIQQVWWRGGWGWRGGWHRGGWGWRGGWGPYNYRPWGWRGYYGGYGGVRRCWIGRWGYRRCAWW
jgi:hypothetical protein